MRGALCGPDKVADPNGRVFTDEMNDRRVKSRLLRETSHHALVAVEQIRRSGEYPVCRLRVKSKGATGSMFQLGGTQR